MEDLINILTEIEHNKSCAVSKLSHPVAKLPLHLPQDLLYYFENYAEISLFDDADYPIKVVGLAEFKRANPIIAGEDAADDVSHNWFIIAHDNHSQYITIDLSKTNWDIATIAFGIGTALLASKRLLPKALLNCCNAYTVPKDNHCIGLNRAFNRSATLTTTNAQRLATLNSPTIANKRPY